MSFFDNVKNMLDILPEDVSSDEKIKLIIAEGKHRLLQYYPTLTDEELEGGFIGDILKSYCRYGFCGQSSLFFENYRLDLENLRRQYIVSVADDEQN